jgi:MFS family permease
MQNILAYSPLQAGVRFLPSTVVLIFVAPVAGRLSDRIGPKIPMTIGLLLTSGSLLWQSTITATTGYERLLPAFVLMGLGMGLVMSPMSTAAMNAVDQTKAGVASGILSTSRMVGGTFGVAVLGALVTGLGRSKLDTLLPDVPAGQRDHLAQSLGAGGAGNGGARVTDALHEAYVYALSNGLKLGAAVAFFGAIVAWSTVADRPHVPVHPEIAEFEPEADAALRDNVVVSEPLSAA